MSTQTTPGPAADVAAPAQTHTATGVHTLRCHDCQLDGDLQETHAGATFLADLHDRLHHRGAVTALVISTHELRPTTNRTVVTR